ncbi:uncharacterized protein BXZ73DRAFT_109962 [Epithele typhae]|uniref:uncharacterized protein n=1 Tax=Epithele typhae TaxID=378194 RepID=UPI00200775AC|nr:uncharacterized protein BXZ73DRAFT_109962 [Epithele typhae]KAH9908238.1 hypothetical protein BXZ73DRAFT_109962 [Epithele typhae]
MSLPTRQLAAINNPNVSEEAKEHSRQMIEELEHDPELSVTREGYEDDKDNTRVNAGHKATLKNPNVSEEAKERSRQFLQERDALDEDS